MKRSLLIGYLLLISACQPAAPTSQPTFTPTATAPASPTPVPASPTPAPTSTPAPTPTPLPRFFTQEFDISLAGWVILQAGNQSLPSVSLENGTLRLHMDSPYTWLYALYSAEDYADVTIEAEYINSALSPAAAGLVCRYSDKDGWLEYNILTDGTYSVLFGRWLDTGIADFIPVIQGIAKNIKQSGDIQQIGLTCSGNILSLYVNGTSIRSVDVGNYELPAGKVGLAASSFENTPVITVFNWVQVSEP